jgi:hypothetical protein
MFKNISGFLKDERGQSTTEYILILSVVVMIAIKFKGQMMSQLAKATDLTAKNIDAGIQNNDMN